VHFGLKPQTGHQGAVDEKSVFHQLDFASLRAKSGNPVPAQAPRDAGRCCIQWPMGTDAYIAPRFKLF
jgi:hypothetical protein